MTANNKNTNLKIDIDKYSHVSFDLWLTLIKSHPEFKGKRNLLFRDFFEIDNLDKVSEVVRHYDVLCNDTCEKTGVNIDAYAIYDMILSELGVDTAIAKGKYDAFYAASESLFLQFKPVLLFEDIHLLFEDIQSQGKTMSILSNTAFIKGATLKKLLAYYDLERFFLFQIYSDETGFSKPNRKIFGQVYQQKQEHNPVVSKSEILHVGDNIIADYNGALDFGFDAFLLKI